MRKVGWFAVLQLIIIFCVPDVFSQVAPAPPPRALIYTPPGKSDFVTIESSDKFFSAVFPGKPLESSSAAGGVTTTTYRVLRAGSNSKVAVITSPVDTSSRVEQMIADLRQRMARRSKSTVHLEREIMVSGHRAIEFEYDHDIGHGLARFILTPYKMVVVECDVTNWSLLTEKTKAEWKAEAERFVSSVRILG